MLEVFEGSLAALLAFAVMSVKAPILALQLLKKG